MLGNLAFPTPLENKNQPCITKSEDKSCLGTATHPDRLLASDFVVHG